MKPTIRQRKVAKRIKEIMEGGTAVSDRQIVRDAGYSEASIINANQIIKSEGVLQALAKYGIDRETLAGEWQKVLLAEPDPTKPISWDSKIKGLAHISKYVYEDQEAKQTPIYNFINKFWNIKTKKDINLDGEEPKIEQ